MSGLDALRRAQEEAFFRKEQERTVMQHIRRLRKEGRFDQIKLKPVSTSAGVLPQVLAQSMPLSYLEEPLVNKKNIDYSFRNKRILKGVCTGNPMYVGGMAASGVSLGRGKWTASTNTVQGTSIFSVADAPKLMGSQAVESVQEQRLAKMMESRESMKLGNMRFKMFPDFTPGRALAWGSTLALWGTGAIVATTCRSFGIKTCEDARVVLQGALSPYGEQLRETMTDVFGNSLAIPTNRAERETFKDIAFTRALKSRLA